MLSCLKISLCCHLRCFVAKSILSRFTRFCVEKNLGNNCVCGEKRTNIRYAFSFQLDAAVQQIYGFSFESETSAKISKYGILKCFQSGVRCRMGSPEVNGGSGGHSLPGQKRWLLKSSSLTNILQFLSTLIALILITTMKRTKTVTLSSFP